MNYERTKISLGNAIITLPPYMICLSQALINEILSNGESLSERIIAAGSHPKDGKVTFLSPDGLVHIFDSKKYYIPHGPYYPTEDGKEVFLSNVSNRWPIQFNGFTVKSSWLLTVSDSSFRAASLQVSNIYLGEFDFENASSCNT